MLIRLLNEIKALHDPVVEALKMDKSVYNELMSDSDFLVGFEAEFLYRLPYNPRWEQDEDLILEDYTDEFYSVLTLLERNLGVEIISNISDDKQKDPKKWYLEIERSIDDLYRDDGLDNDPDLDSDLMMGMELVSGTVPIKAAMEYLNNALDWIDINGVTHSDTGLHLNISYGNRPTGTFDALKILLLMGEEELLYRYGREFNLNTQSHIDALSREAKTINFQDFSNKTEDIDVVINRLNSHIIRDKHFTINYGQFLQRGYMEFRVTGGEDYGSRIKEIIDQMLQFALLMKAGYNRDLYRKEYLMKLYKFLKSINPDPTGEKTRNVKPNGNLPESPNLE